MRERERGDEKERGGSRLIENDPFRHLLLATSQTETARERRVCTRGLHVALSEREKGLRKREKRGKKNVSKTTSF